jgi:hypothetical protein
MQERMGIVKEAYHEGKAGKYIRAVLAGTSGRSQTRAALGETALLLGSALTANAASAPASVSCYGHVRLLYAPTCQRPSRAEMSACPLT